MTTTNPLTILLFGLILLSGLSYSLIPNAQAETKSIEAIVSLEPYTEDRIKISVGFIDVIGQPISHVNYDITVQHNFVTTVLEDSVHVHSGKGSHITIPLDIKPNSSDVIDIEIVFRGIGITEPYGGPIGKIFRIIEYPNLSQDDMKNADFTEPLLIIPDDIAIQTKDPGGARVDYTVRAIDDVDGVIEARCDPISGSIFPIGKTIVKCFAVDAAFNTVERSFTITVEGLDTPDSIPSWIKNIAAFWCNNEIDDSGFVEAVQYLIDNKVITIPSTDSESYSNEVPSWIKNNACWWSDGLITDKDFTEGLQYLVRTGIIQSTGF